MNINAVINEIIHLHSTRTMVDLPADDMDFGERFQAVVGQTVLLTIGLHQNAASSIWQFEIATLANSWYAESDEPLPARTYHFSAGFSSFGHAMAALCDAVRLLEKDDSFTNI